MKYSFFKKNENILGIKTKKLNIKRILKIAIPVLILIAIITVILVYRNNESFREFFDVKILRKEISSENTLKIDLDSDVSNYLYAYDKYVSILSENVLKIYSNSDKPDNKLDVVITNPVYDSNNRFLCIGEKGGNKVYLINGTNIVWQKDIDGEISKVSVNRNGYVVISVSTSGYKTVLDIYNPKGEELFKTYLPTKYCLDMEISNDNKYLAIAETDTSGTILQTDIRTISIENAKNDPSNAFYEAYSDTNKEIITNIKYQNKNTLVCMFDDKIIKLGTENHDILELDSNTIFADIELENRVMKVEKHSMGLLQTEYKIKFINVENLAEHEYKLESLPKSIYTNENIIAINYGSVVEIVNSDGWLLKRYNSNKEVNSIELTDVLAAIVYHDRVEIVHF